MGKMKHKNNRAKGVLLVVLALAIILAVTSSTGAVTSTSAKATSGKSLTVFDPFTLKVLPSTVSSAPPANSAGLIKNPNPRPPIRIPARPNCRSGFRPHADC